MPGPVTFKIEVTDQGDVIIRLPEGKGQQLDAAKVADLTKELAEAIGKITERHVGAHHHHDHGHQKDHDHLKA